MPPRLAHRKSRAGCLRCKARKVKCDEILPKCSACVRHNVPCHYPGSGTPSSPLSAGSRELRASEHALELRLMHEWMAYVCESFSIAWEYWRFQAPLIALEHRYVLDALLALSALHLSRKEPKVWNSVEGRMVSLNHPDGPSDSTPSSSAAGPGPDPRHGEKEWKAVSKTDGQTPSESSPGTATTTSSSAAAAPAPASARSPSLVHHQHHVDMLHVSRTYFDRALDGQRKAVADLNADTIHAVYTCSILVTNYGLLNLSEESYGPDIPPWDPIKWYRVAEGSRHIASRWQELAGGTWYRLAGNFYGQPDLSDNDELFHPRHRKPFDYLLGPVGGDEIGSGSGGGGVVGGGAGGGGTDPDREAYEFTLSYVGLLYRGIVERFDAPKASSRRIVALPSRVPPRFAQLIEEQRPRALAILAHAFAAIKLLDGELPWFKGIAERQVPILARSVPEAWAPMMRWPLRIAEGLPGEMVGEG